MATVDSIKRTSRFQDLTGRTLGRWYVIGCHSNNRQGHALWLCRCECGTEKIVSGSNLRSGESTQCRRCGRKTHGQSGSPEHVTWKAMLARCKSHPRYQGRGITVCDRWLTFENFFADMGPKPSLAHSIERINNEGNYEPDNCQWATPKEQSRNKRNNRLLTFQGQTKCVGDWAEETGIHYQTLTSRLNHGWSVEQALTAPV